MPHHSAPLPALPFNTTLKNVLLLILLYISLKSENTNLGSLSPKYKVDTVSVGLCSVYKKTNKPEWIVWQFQIGRFGIKFRIWAFKKVKVSNSELLLSHGSRLLEPRCSCWMAWLTSLPQSSFSPCAHLDFHSWSLRTFLRLSGLRMIYKIGVAALSCLK